jgi:two-component system cell cycle sensor histidine kinase/response regulator CckA
MDRESSARAAGERRDFERARLNLARMQVSGGDALKTALASTTETAATTLNVERVGIWLYVQGRKAIRCFDLFQSGQREHSEGAILCADDFPEYFDALENQRAIAAVEALTDPRTKRLKDAYLDPLGITSMLDAPIFREGQVVGVVCHEHVGTPRRWTREECDFAGTVADSIALKFESAGRLDAERSRKALEAHLAEIRKMDAVGQLAASIAHDFKNILTVVLAGAQLISKKAAATPDILKLAKQILEAVDRGNLLTTELMTFGRTQQQHTRVLDVASAIERMAPMLQTAVGERFSINMRRGAAGLVLLDRAQFERVILNLVLNARDALPQGGNIDISVGTARVAEGTDEASDYTIVDVADGGIGMDAATRERICEPFFTTKSKDKGTGLGMSIVHRIIDRAGGFLHVVSEIGKGTSVRLYLPRVSSGGLN